MLNCKSGIYAIVNTLNGRRYIGSSVNIRKRFRSHRLALDSGTHGNRRLLASWGKHGADAFEFVPLEYVHDVTQLHLREQWHLDQYQPHVYNFGTCASNPILGTKRSEQTRAKIGAANSIARKGKKHSDETKRRISAAKIGKPRPWTDEWQAKIHAHDVIRGQKTHCKYGHEYTDNNTSWKMDSAGRKSRRCRTCGRADVYGTYHRLRGRPLSDANKAALKASWSTRVRKVVTHCKHGHEYTPENTYTNRNGWRSCNTCRRALAARVYAERKQAVVA